MSGTRAAPSFFDAWAHESLGVTWQPSVDEHENASSSGRALRVMITTHSERRIRLGRRCSTPR